MCKNAQVSIQFNWIFVLIAGAIILLFFAGLVIKQKGVSETKFCGSVLNNLDATFSLVTESSGTQKSTEMSNLIIDLDCNEYRCRDSENIPAKPFGKTPVFSPGTLDGRFLEISSKEWSVPFRVTNFLFVTTKETRYYIVYQGSPDFANLISEDLPDNITKEIISTAELASLTDKHDNHVRFIFVNSPKQSPNFVSEGMTALEIDSIGKSLVFYNWANGWTENEKSYYVNHVDMQAAIFSDNYNNFICSMQKAYERLDHISTLNYFRTGYLKKDVDQDTLCPFTLGKAEDRLNDLSLASSSCLENINYACVSDISSITSNLRELNNILIREGCPLIY